MIYELTALKPPFLAKNMQELYSKVTRGKYPAIPTHYSKELATMIGYCLSVDPTMRPSAQEIWNMPKMGGGGGNGMVSSPAKRQQAHKRANSHTARDTGSKIELLKTIKMPRNLK